MNKAIQLWDESEEQKPKIKIIKKEKVEHNVFYEGTNYSFHKPLRIIFLIL